jgi:hypothetical protein
MVVLLVLKIVLKNGIVLWTHLAVNMFLRELIREDVAPNAYEKLKAEFPNLNTILRYVPGVGQAMAVADAASAIDMYQKTMADIEVKYPNIVNTLKPDPHLDVGNDDFEKDMTPVEESGEDVAFMGKLEDNGKVVRILKKAHNVQFSDKKGWLLIDTDPGKGAKGLGAKWIPADTRFTWVRPFHGHIDENFADGRHPEDKGDSKRHGIPKHASLSSLDKIAHQGGRKGQLAHWQANMRRGRMKEDIDSPDLVDILAKFLPFCMKALELKQLPKIKLEKQIDAGPQPTFGMFDPDASTITLGISNRHPLDIIRTLAHELVHYRQAVEDRLNDESGTTGSDEENEANAGAGILMRSFGKQHPEFFAVKPISLSEEMMRIQELVQEDATAGGTSAGAIATTVSPHLAIGNVKKYGKGAPAKPPKAAQALNKDGTAKNALDLPGASLMGGKLLKR